MDIWGRIFSHKKITDGVNPDDMGALVVEACRLQHSKDLRLRPEEIESVAVEMNVDAAYLEEAFNMIRLRKTVKRVGYAAAGIVVVAIGAFLLYSWWNQPVVTQGSRSLLESGLEELQAR